MSLGKNTIDWLNIILLKTQYIEYLEKMIIEFRGRLWENPFYCKEFGSFWWYMSHGGYIEIEPICAYFEDECLTMDCETCVNNDGWFK